MAKDNSDFAFPGTKQWFSEVLQEWIQVPTQGMTKRELIAMHALSRAPHNTFDHELNAEWAVHQADALLAELEKE